MTLIMTRTRILCSRGLGLLEHDIDENKDFDILLKRTHRQGHEYLAQEDYDMCIMTLDKDEDKDMHILLKRMVKF